MRRPCGSCPTCSGTRWSSGWSASGGELRAFGAGILSSVGETSSFRDADLRPVDLLAMGRADYDITRFQPVLYVWSSAGGARGRAQPVPGGRIDDATPGPAAQGRVVGRGAGSRARRQP